MLNIRNFCIIAHIDHGKSTLADRFMQLTGAISERQLTEQTLDKMDLEKERGITIKLQPVRMTYVYNGPLNKYKGKQFILNLIDTPGHIDFSYEVSRSLIACEGALLVIDATQGIQAQTLANLYTAMEFNLTIIPVLNKIDLPNSDPEARSEEIKQVLGYNPEDIFLVSGKTGQGVPILLEKLVELIPEPRLL